MTKLLINEPPLQVLPSLAAAIGLNEAIVLQQIHYLLRTSRNARNGRRWVYNTYPEWQARYFPFWSVRTIQRIFRSLEERGLLLTTVANARRGDRTKWYTIDYSRLDQYDKLAYSQYDKVAYSLYKRTESI